MKDTSSIRESTTHQTRAAENTAPALPARSPVWLDPGCSPRARIAFSALETVRSARVLFGSLLHALKSMLGARRAVRADRQEKLPFP